MEWRQLACLSEARQRVISDLVATTAPAPQPGISRSMPAPPRVEHRHLYHHRADTTLNFRSFMTPRSFLFRGHRFDLAVVSFKNVFD